METLNQAGRLKPISISANLCSTWYSPISKRTGGRYSAATGASGDTGCQLGRISSAGRTCWHHHGYICAALAKAASLGWECAREGRMVSSSMGRVVFAFTRLGACKRPPTLPVLIPRGPGALQLPGPPASIHFAPSAPVSTAEDLAARAIGFGTVNATATLRCGSHCRIAPRHRGLLAETCTLPPKLNRCHGPWLLQKHALGRGR